MQKTEESVEKLWNWNMDNTCANSCATFLVAHMHVVNTMTLVIFLMWCYFMTFLINTVEYKNFKTTTEKLMFVSIIVYVSWNVFFGFPMKYLNGNETNVSFGYTSYAMTPFLSIVVSTIILFLNRYC